MSPVQKAAARKVSILDRVAKIEEATRSLVVQPRFIVIERVDRPSVPVMISISRRGDCD